MKLPIDIILHTLKFIEYKRTKINLLLSINYRLCCRLKNKHEMEYIFICDICNKVICRECYNFDENYFVDCNSCDTRICSDCSKNRPFSCKNCNSTMDIFYCSKKCQPLYGLFCFCCIYDYGEYRSVENDEYYKQRGVLYLVDMNLKAKSI